MSITGCSRKIHSSSRRTIRWTALTPICSVALNRAMVSPSVYLWCNFAAGQARRSPRSSVIHSASSTVAGILPGAMTTRLSFKRNSHHAVTTFGRSNGLTYVFALDLVPRAGLLGTCLPLGQQHWTHVSEPGNGCGREFRVFGWERLP